MKIKKILPPVITVISILGSIMGIIQLAKAIIKSTGNIFPIEIPLWILVFFLLLISSLSMQIVIFRKKLNRSKNNESRFLFSFGELLDEMHKAITSARHDVYIVGLEKDAVFVIVISLLIAKLNDVKITYIYYNEFHERYRLLKYLGCNVIHHDLENKAVKFAGVIVDPNDIFYSKALVLTPRPKEGVFARLYFGTQDQYMINAANTIINGFIARKSTSVDYKENGYLPEVIETDQTELFEMLKNVKFYKNCSFELKEIDIRTTMPISRFIVKNKLTQIIKLVKLYKEKGWVIFKPLGIKLKNGKTSLIVPPVVEEHNGKLLVAEGHTRIHYLLSQNIHNAYVVIVRGVETEFSLSPTKWSKLTVLNDRIDDNDFMFARHIETSTHKDVWSE